MHAEALAALVEEVENFQGPGSPPRSELPLVAQETADLIEEMLEANLIQEKLLTLETAPAQHSIIPAPSALAAPVVRAEPGGIGAYPRNAEWPRHCGCATRGSGRLRFRAFQAGSKRCVAYRLFDLCPFPPISNLFGSEIGWCTSLP